MQPSIVQAQSIMLDGGTTPGCLPPARGAARERIIHTAPEALALASYGTGDGFERMLLYLYFCTDGHS